MFDMKYYLRYALYIYFFHVGCYEFWNEWNELQMSYKNKAFKDLGKQFILKMVYCFTKKMHSNLNTFTVIHENLHPHIYIHVSNH